MRSRSGYGVGMKLEQGQLWKSENGDLLRIVRWERMEIEYKRFAVGQSIEDATVHTVTKKAFCRLIKGAELQPPEAAL